MTTEAHHGPRFPLGGFHLEECRSWGAIVLNSACVVRNGDHSSAPRNSARFPYRGRSRPVRSDPLSGFEICAPVRLTITGIPNAPETFGRPCPGDGYPLTCTLILSTAPVRKGYVEHTLPGRERAGEGVARSKIFRVFHQVR